MAEVNTLEEKLAEVLGLALAAQGATQKVEGLVADESIQAELRQMREEAEETERRCAELADQRDGKKTAILKKARETKAEAEEMMSTYLGDDSDGLDGFEFMTMAEAGEVGHWAVLRTLNERAGEGEISELVEWALPIQERHFETVKRWPSRSRPRKIRTPSKGPKAAPQGAAFSSTKTRLSKSVACWLPLVNPITLRPTARSIAAVYSGRTTSLTAARIGATSSASPASASVRSNVADPPCKRTRIASSRTWVRTLTGPRPKCFFCSATISREIVLVTN